MPATGALLAAFSDMGFITGIVMIVFFVLIAGLALLGLKRRDTRSQEPTERDGSVGPRASSQPSELDHRKKAG